ncbi:DedA family protein [Gracilimonas amylolytica]|uniref:DedA family protein n=1 Tax=Gracilimonas amylolytica TaxID=1749045 RepID=UPI0012FFEBD1|nr:DedA family protein [Gracilimonas amylolytica]
MATYGSYANGIGGKTNTSWEESSFLWQDSLTSDSASNADSFDRMLPYLNEVKSEADSQQELILIYALVILLSTWFSEDFACIGAGLLVANGFIPFWQAAFAAILGIYIGDFAFYLSGRILGTRVFEIAPFKWLISKEAVDKSVKWFNQKGPVLLVASRFIPGSRIPIYLSAGILKTSFWKFLLYFGGTTLIWTPIFVWISRTAGDEIYKFYETYDDYAIWFVLPSILILWGLYKLITPLFTQRGRRILLNRWNRLFKS